MADYELYNDQKTWVVTVTGIKVKTIVGACVPATTVKKGGQKGDDKGRVNDWRGGFRTWGVSVVRLLSRFLGVSIQSITPFPAAAHQTGHAHFAHPAFTCMNSSRLRSQQVGA
jgi:hypothetical protein